MAPLAPIDRFVPPATAADELEGRIVEAMLRGIGQWGIAKTTADDVARMAGVSRATLYRAFPGGKDVLFDAVLRHEAARFFHAVTDRLDDADTLEDLLVVGIVEAADFLLAHEALGYVLRHEPERVLPAFAFHRLDGVLRIATAFTAPHLVRFVPDADAAQRGAEWVVRLLISYALNPSPALDLADPGSVRRFVRTYALPILTPSADTALKEH